MRSPPDAKKSARRSFASEPSYRLLFLRRASAKAFDAIWATADCSASEIFSGEPNFSRRRTASPVRESALSLSHIQAASSSTSKPPAVVDVLQPARPHIAAHDQNVDLPCAALQEYLRALVGRRSAYES